MKVIGLGKGKRRGLEDADVPGKDGEDIFLILKKAFDLQKGLPGDEQAQLLEKIAADKGVGQAGFIFEADEDIPFAVPGR